MSKQNKTTNTTQSTQSQSLSTRPRSKAGRTLLVKPTSSNFDKSIFTTFTGHQSTHHTEKSNSYFIIYSSSQEALSALKGIKSKCGHDVRVKFSHYRIFFKLEGLTDKTDYNNVKNVHTKLASDKNCTVLYYRLYRKDNKFIGCGDMTIDTKEAFDTLISEEGLKNFTFKVDDVEFKGIHYRYKKSQDDENKSVDE
jgi:hypothetical protein